jgi:hypothetical protein
MQNLVFYAVKPQSIISAESMGASDKCRETLSET